MTSFWCLQINIKGRSLSVESLIGKKDLIEKKKEEEEEEEGRVEKVKLTLIQRIYSGDLNSKHLNSELLLVHYSDG